MGETLHAIDVMTASAGPSCTNWITQPCDACSTAAAKAGARMTTTVVIRPGPELLDCCKRAFHMLGRVQCSGTKAASESPALSLTEILTAQSLGHRRGHRVAELAVVA